MRTSFLFIVLLLLLPINIFSQSTIKAEGNTRIGVIGETWHPLGIIVNPQFDGAFGIYTTVKSNYEATQTPLMNQYNITAGISLDIFQRTCDLLLGASYMTHSENEIYYHNQKKWGFEILLMTQFSDRNWRMIFGLNSNNINIEEGLTAGFAYQF